MPILMMNSFSSSYLQQALNYPLDNDRRYTQFSSNLTPGHAHPKVKMNDSNPAGCAFALTSVGTKFREGPENDFPYFFIVQDPFGHTFLIIRSRLDDLMPVCHERVLGVDFSAKLLIYVPKVFHQRLFSGSGLPPLAMLLSNCLPAKVFGGGGATGEQRLQRYLKFSEGFSTSMNSLQSSVERPLLELGCFLPLH